MAKRRKEIDVNEMDELTAFRSRMEQEFNVKLPEPVIIDSGNTLLNKVIGGGFRTGVFTMFAAAAGSGKSTEVVKIISNFQRQYDNGYVLYIECEQSTDIPRLRSLGVDTENKRFFRIPYSITIEKAFNVIDGIIDIKEKYNTQDVPTLVVIDSIDATPSEKELEVETAEKSTGVRAKVLNFLMRKYMHKFAKYNIGFITVNHITKKLSMNAYEGYDGRLASLGDFVIAGGKAMMFYPHTLIWFRPRMTKSNDEEISRYGVHSGFIVEATTLKCKSYSFKITVPLVFNTLKGIDEIPTRLLNLELDDIICGRGKSLFLPNYEEFKFQIESVPELYETNNEFKNKFDECWFLYLNDKYAKYDNLLAKMDTSSLNAISIDVPEIAEEHLHELVDNMLVEESQETSAFDETDDLKIKKKRDISYDKEDF